MNIETMKIDLLQRLLTIDSEDILIEIEKILDRDLEMNPNLSQSIQAGLANIEQGETMSHEEVRKLYDKWL